MQDGRLRGQPTGQHPREVAAAGDTDNAAFGQGDRHRDVGGCPGDLAFVFLCGRVLHDDLARQVGGAQPQVQIVGVVPAAFPQASAWPGGGEQNARRVGEVAAAGCAFGEERLLGVGLDVLTPLVIFGQLFTVAALAVPVTRDVHADHTQWADDSHQQEVVLAEDKGHRDARNQRKRRHQERHGTPLRLGRLAGQLVPCPPDRRQQPGRPVEVQPRPVVGRFERGVRPARSAYRQQHGSDRELGAAGGQVDRADQGLTFDEHAAGVRPDRADRGDRGDGRCDPACAVHRHGDRHGFGGGVRVVQAHGAGLRGADRELTGAEPVDDPGTRPADHTDLDQARWFGRKTGRW